MQIHKIIIGTGIAVAAALPFTTIANGVTFPSCACTSPSPSNASKQGMAGLLFGGDVSPAICHIPRSCFSGKPVKP